MRALEFKSKIKNNQIPIPVRIQSELLTNRNKDIRVIVLIDDPEIYDEFIFQQATKDQYFKGYADSDSIYDKF